MIDRRCLAVPCVLGIGLVLLARAAGSAGLQDQKRDGASDSRRVPAAVERVSIPGVENAFRLSARLYSGGQPEGEASFSALKKLGVKTILTVDGSRPDVAEARRHGIRYVHLPVGYDGIGPDQAARIVQAARTLEGPVFIHCHHGKHRGPTAAALCGMALEGWTREQALAWMTFAGTSPEYGGLYATARAYRPPSPAEWQKIPTDWPEQATVTASAEAMVDIDHRWDLLKAYRQAGYRPPANSPEFDAGHEALLLKESFREMARLDEVRARGQGFLRAVERSERLASALEQALRELAGGVTDRSRSRVDDAFTDVGKNCTSCHARYRDRASEGDPDAARRDGPP